VFAPRSAFLLYLGGSCAYWRIFLDLPLWKNPQSRSTGRFGGNPGLPSTPGSSPGPCGLQLSIVPPVTAA
uniref:Uncharacterized protein n=1 Tax=Chrysemys picta bellii TaxID=8478 RepID=A0A8C3HA30_CHRPI